MLMNGSSLGSYVVRKELGQGATSRVYYGWDNARNAPVALKVLDPEMGQNASVVAMFEDEGRAGLAVDSPQLVKTLTTGKLGKFRFIAFEYVHGIPLAHLIEKGPLAEGEVVWVMRHVAQALRELYRKGIVHQDVKPENILLEKSGNCRLSDLGFARMKNGRVNWDGCSAGSSYYMSPEACQPWLRLPIDTRSDLYALAAVMYHAATGNPPFVADTDEKIREMQIRRPVVPPNKRNPSLSLQFSDILQQMLDKDPENRIPTPEHLLLEIRQIPVKAAAPAVNITEVS
jgi:eukaryotic-like serine/threonine-protein kinase